MPRGDHCAVWGCDNDRRYPEKQIILPHVGALRFYSPLTKADLTSWGKTIMRDKFKVTYSTKVCSNHFKAGYRHSQCRIPTLFMRGYDNKETKPVRGPPKVRTTCSRKRKLVKDCTLEEGELTQNCDEVEPIPCESKGHVEALAHEKLSPEAEKRRYFIEQATNPTNCFRYTGISRPKLDLIFNLIKETSTTITYWRGSKSTIKPSNNIKRKKTTNEKRILSKWEEFILTLVRLRKGFDVHFLSDTFSVTAGHVSRIFNTWVIFLSEELSFLVPWPSMAQIQRNLPKRFKNFANARVIIDCVELYLQKPKLPPSQKITWSNYKHWNTAKLLVGITPTGVISFIPPLWAGSISDKEIVRNSGLIDLLDEGDAVMADKGFLIRDLLTFHKVHLISPAYCRGPRLSSRGTTHTRRVASLRTHVERNILSLKQFRIISGVIPLLLKPMLDRIVFLCAALSNLRTRSIK